MKGYFVREHWLVISHEASNSGAPRMLLEVLRGVREAQGEGWSCEFLLGRGGVLLPQFAEIGPVHILAHRWAEPKTFAAGLYRKFIDRPWSMPWRLRGFIGLCQGRNFDLIYNNTATNGYLVPAVRSLESPVLTHVHELGYAMQRFNTTTSLRQTLDNTDHFLAVSPAVAVDLQVQGVASERITITPNFITKLPAEADDAARREARAALGLSQTAAVVVGCGHIDWIKGTDFFVEVAGALAQLTQRELIFAWIGGESDAGFARKVKHLVRRLKMNNVVRFVGPVRDPTSWFSASDLVTVTSREESFSLVALEVGALARPVVGFSGARGLEGLFAETPDLLVASFDPRAMALIVQQILQDPAIARHQGLRLRSKIAQEYLAGPCVAKILSAVARLKSLRNDPVSA
jgi:glycosyltransferase involved in cell wall biosynthesis